MTLEIAATSRYKMGFAAIFFIPFGSFFNMTILKIDQKFWKMTNWHFEDDQPLY